MATELTVDRVRERTARLMGWRRPQDWPSEFEPVEIANEAGEWLYSIEEWNSLVRPLTELSLVQDQGWIDLPADFGRIVGDRITTQTGFGHTLKLATIEQVRDARSLQPGGNSLAYVGCISHTGPVAAGPRSLARLEIGPVPSTSQSDVFLLAYKAGWQEVTDGSDHILVPSWMTSVYLAAFHAIVAGREAEDGGDVDDRLGKLLIGPQMIALRNRDLSIQSSQGQMRGGVGEMYGDYDTPITSIMDVPIVGSNV